MFRPRSLRPSGARRAVILMIVLVLLTLFAVVGLAFVLYANANAESARVYREANTFIDLRPNADPYQLGNYSLGQFLYGGPDPVANGGVVPSGAYSAMRGYSLDRDLYGWNSDSPGSNIYPFNGVGRLHSTNGNKWGLDDHNLISYVPYAADGFVRDPERNGMRADVTQPMGPYTGGWNSSYTYPDLNHLYLAAVDGNGNVLVPSFHRSWNGFGSLDPSNPNWTDTTKPWLKYMTLRPRPADMGPGFPLPGDAGGDVKNLQGFPGGNDSIWIDLDSPVMVAADGTKYKPLFAFLVMDLDGRINLNVHGNVRGQNLTHLSNQGWGRWEVNPRLLTANPALQAEWANLLVGSAAAPRVPGRYGPDMLPAVANNVALAGRGSHLYAQVDYDASNGGQGGVPTGRYQLPGAGAANFASFPLFPPGYGNGSQRERTNHPSLYDSLAPRGDDRRFDASNLTLVLNGGRRSSNALTSDVGQLMPQNFRAGAAGFRVRNMVTTDSIHLDRAGLTPWLFDRNGPANTYAVAVANPNNPPSGPPVAWPNLALRSPNPPAGITGNVPPNSEFRTPGASYYLPSPPNAPNTPNPAIDWRSIDAALAKVDLNRFLPPYPHQGSGTSPANATATPMTANGDPNGRFDTAAPLLQQFQAAHQARQQMADDIYRRLLLVTGVPSVASPAAPSDLELAPRRWLAQLAANIVDFIDDDEISTPFNFYTARDANNDPKFDPGALNNNSATGQKADPELPRYWVFGTELPRVLINEVLAEYVQPLDKNKMKTAGPLNVNVFAELFNAMPSAAQLGGSYPNTGQPIDAQPVPLFVAPANGTAGYNPYRVVVASTSAAAGAGGLLPAPGVNGNVLGTPEFTRTQTDDGSNKADFASPTAIQTVGGGAAPATIAPQQFFLLGPGPDARGAITAPAVPPATPLLTSPNMTYSVNTSGPVMYNWDIAGTKITDNTAGVSVLLRRLTNPHLPPDNRPTLKGAANPGYNPYVTIDYVRGIAPNDATDPTVVYHSAGKQQPYAANPGFISPQVPAGMKPPNTQHTFGLQNSPAPASGHYDWLTHLDRQLISAMELLHVSGYHPHQLTNRFMTPAASFAHRVPWYSEANRLYRAFEFLDTKDRSVGVSAGGRVPGKININTLWDPAVFQALCDAQAGNGFTPAQVAAVYNQLVALRSPGLVPPAAPPPGWAPQITGQDRPFLGMGIGNLPAADPQAVYDNGTPKGTTTGIEDTFLRSFGGTGKATDPRLFDVTGPGLHPYQQAELMTKIYGSVTNRSNVFAVWVTVGFFQVTNDAVKPVQLGAEVGAATNTNIRHRLFAVIDRSKMAIGPSVTTTVAGTWGSVPGPGAPTAASPGVLNQPAPVQITAPDSKTLPGQPAGSNGIPWAIGPAVMVPAGGGAPVALPAGPPTTLVFDAGTPSEETVIVQPPPPGWTPPPNNTAQPAYWVWATFQKEHGVVHFPPGSNPPAALTGNVSITIPGNPGPQPVFDVNDLLGYGNVVIAYSVLQ